MKEIFLIREILIIFYRKNEIWINFVIKFLAGIIVFTCINKFGYVKSLSEMPIIILMGLLTMILPISLLSLLMIAMIVIQLLTVSLELAVIVSIVLICFTLFYIRIFPKESLLIFAIVLAYYFKVPYIVVFIGAMFFGIAAIPPIAIGTFIWHSIPIIINLAQVGGSTIKGIASKDLLEIPSEFAKVYIAIIKSINTDQTWLVSIIIFSMIIILMYIILHLQVDYSAYLAIAVGLVVNMISFMLSSLVSETSIEMGGMIISTLFCAGLACIIQFFRIVLDYSSSEKVEFEDDSNYYYVKVIPKISIQKQRKNKKIKERL